MTKTFKRWVVYVGSDAHDETIFCPGSRAVMKLIDAIKEDVHVQSVDVLLEKKVALPEWLWGTPTVVDTTNRVAYTGTEAVNVIRDASGGNETRAPTHDEMIGINAYGSQSELGTEDGDDAASVFVAPIDQARLSIDMDKKVTDEDVQRYISSRNAALPEQPPQ